MKKLLFFGVLAGLLGAAALIQPSLAPKPIMRPSGLGRMTIETGETVSPTVPPLVAGGFVVLGLLLTGGGLYKLSQ